MGILPTFVTERLVVREVVEADIPNYSRYFADYEVIRQLTRSVPWPYPADGVETFLKTQVFPAQGNDRWVWAICLKEAPEHLIGSVDLNREASPAHRGFWLGRPYWGKGYMTEAVEPIMDYAFDALGFETMVFANAVGNKRSGRVKEKTGARFVRYEAAEYVDPDLSGREVYELTKDEWRAFKAAREGAH